MTDGREVTASDAILQDLATLAHADPRAIKVILGLTIKLFETVFGNVTIRVSSYKNQHGSNGTDESRCVQLAKFQFSASVEKFFLKA